MNVVFHEVDRALRDWMKTGIGSSVSFAIPDRSFHDSERTSPTVNLHLYGVAQDPERMAGNWVGVRARDGRVVGRQPPTRHFRARYLLTAWAASQEEEHELLGAALTVLVSQDTVPLPHLTGSLLAANQPVPVAVGSEGAPVELWSALGIAPRAGLDLVVTVPLVPPLVTDLAPRPARVELGAGESGGAGEHRTRRL